MTARMSNSAPSSPAHTSCSLFLKMNCLHNPSVSIINNAYRYNLKTTDTRLSSVQSNLTKALVPRTLRSLSDGRLPHTPPFTSLEQSLIFNQISLLWGASSQPPTSGKHTVWEQKGMDVLVRTHTSTSRKTLV